MVEPSSSGCRRQPRSGEKLIDMKFDSAESGSELGRSLGLPGGE